MRYKAFQWAGSVAQVIEHLLYDLEALSLNPSPTKKKKRAPAAKSFGFKLQYWFWFSLKPLES
jgi:hypothetical protein